MSDSSPVPEPCGCELPGYFHSGVPGIIAAMEEGRLAPGAGVERCDQCRRFESDEAALKRLIELGLAESRPVGELWPFTVHCYAVVRVKFAGVMAADPRQAVQQALDRFCWETHGRSAEFTDDFDGFVVDFDGDSDRWRSCEFDGDLNDVRRRTA